MKKMHVLFIVFVCVIFIRYVPNDNRNAVQVVNRVGSFGNVHLGNKILAEQAIIRHISAESKLIVLQTEVSEDILLDDTYFDLSILRKNKKVTFYANGVFALDLNISSENVTIDWENRIITVCLSYPYLNSVYVNEEKTRYYETDTGFFRFGEIKLAPEEYSAVIQYVTASATEKLNQPSLIEEAAASAESAVTALIETLNVSQGQDEWGVSIIFE